MEKTDLKRCAWAVGDALTAYHDNEYGNIKTSDSDIFEQICLNVFGAGRVKSSLIDKRDALCEAFFGYDIEKCAGMGDDDIANAAGITGLTVAKAAAVAQNARASQKLIEENGSLFKFIYVFKRPDRLLSALKSYGYTQIGNATAAGIMKSLGVIEAHEHNCFMRTAAVEEV